MILAMLVLLRAQSKLVKYSGITILIGIYIESISARLKVVKQ